MIHATYQTTPAGSSAISPSKRSLILHDSATFLLLTLATVALFGVTWFLFRSFDSHRAELAKSLSDQGRRELREGQPARAVVSLRTALSYAPDDYQSQLLLAQALADSGETDQATNYFLNLWAAKPGDGFLNLQLARLERLKGDRSQAVGYYRASIFGDWRGDGSIKRRDVRLELADYLIDLHDDTAARVELLIAAGNAPPSLHLDGLFADKLRATGDLTDALTYYEKAIADQPHNAAALAAAGRIVYGQGDYAKAHTLLARAVEYTPAGSADRAELETLARNSERLVELSLSRELPAHERAEHLLTAAKIAQARLASCGVASSAGGAAVPGWVSDLEARWKASRGSKLNALVENAAGQDALTQLIFDTERQAAACGTPSGDDALLLMLAGKTEGAE